MRPSETDALFGALRAADPDVMDSDEIAVLTGQVARLKGWCDALQVRATRRQRALAAEGRAAAPADTLSRHGGQSVKDAKATEDRETVCSSMPGFESAMADGVVAAGHVDAIAAATRNLDEVARAEFAAEVDSLLHTAAKTGVDAFARNCRDLARSIRNRQTAGVSDAEELAAQRDASKISRWIDRESGMHKTLIELDPVSDREFWSAVQAQRDVLRARTVNRQVSWDRLTVDALLECVGSSGSGRWVPSIRVHISLERLLSDGRPGMLCETDSGVPVPVETVRRMACEADLIPMVFNGAGVLLDEGAGEAPCYARAAGGDRSHATHLRPPRLHGDHRRLPGASRDVLA